MTDVMEKMSENNDVADYRAAVSGWLDENLPAGFLSDSPTFADPGTEEIRDWERRLYEAGYSGMTIPRAYGGQGLSFDEHLIVNQEVGRRALPESVNSIGKEIISTILMAMGTEEQKRTYLPGIFSMKHIWCQGFSEPQAGSDLAAVRTKAVRDGGKWRINGSKIWTSYAQRADFCLLLVRTGDPADRYRSLSLIIVPMGTKGIDIRPIRQIDGSDEFCEVFFDDVLVDADGIVGEVDAGWSGAVSVLSVERATNRMYRGWRFENELRHLVSVCKAEPVLKVRLADSGTAAALRALSTDARVVQLYAEKIVAMIREDRSPGPIGSLMKLHWSEAHQRLADFALRLLGAQVPDPSPALMAARRRFQTIYLRARSESLIAGSSEIQSAIIADRFMGLPKGRAAQ